MKQVGPDGDLIFSSTEFGSGSVTKTAQIAEILKELLSNLTITTKSEDTKLVLSNYYNKLEIQEILENYVKITELASEVSKQLDALLKDPEFNKFASQEDLDALNEAIKGYDNTINTILGNQQSLQSSWNEYRTSLNETISLQNSTINNLSSGYNALSSSVSSLQNILNNLNLIDLSQFASQVGTIQTDLSNLKDSIGDLSTLKTTAKGTLVAAINELVDNQGNLSTLKTTAKDTLVAAINELFQSASDGKSLIADAITGKGVDASAEDTFSSLAAKITAISTGYDTSDANITAADITLGKVGYGSSGRLVGEHSCSSGGSTDLNSLVTAYDSSETLIGSNTTRTICSGKKGVVIPTVADAMCDGGDEIVEGSIYYVIDGTEYSVDNYLPYTKIQFNTSFAIKVGELLYPNGSGTCEYCGGSPVFIWGGVVIAE